MEVGGWRLRGSVVDFSQSDSSRRKEEEEKVIGMGAFSAVWGTFFLHSNIVTEKALQQHPRDIAFSANEALQKARRRRETRRKRKATSTFVLPMFFFRSSLFSLSYRRSAVDGVLLELLSHVDGLDGGLALLHGCLLAWAEEG